MLSTSTATGHRESQLSYRLSPSIIQIRFIWFIPESPRWLISEDRSEEALEVLGKYHANVNIHDPTAQCEHNEIKETLRLEFLYKKTSSYLDFLKTKGNRYRFLLIISLGLFSQWSGNGLISYYTKKDYESVGIDDANTLSASTAAMPFSRSLYRSPAPCSATESAVAHSSWPPRPACACSS
jgi:Sugar (and other) transporter